MKNSERLIWLNGEIMRTDDAKINVLSPTSQFGANVFEGIRCYWNKNEEQLYAFRLQDHYKRLLNSIKVFQLDNPYTIQQWEDFLKKIIQVNDYKEDIAVRQTLFVEGDGSWFSKGPVGMFIAPIAKSRNCVPLKNGIRGCISSWERISDSVISPKIKSGANYINSRMAQLEALNNGYDTAIFMNKQGKIAEGPGSCIFIIRNGVLITPPVTASILESITRDTILKIAEKLLELPIEIRNIDRTELYISDEIFLCGSAAEVTPICYVDAFSIGNGFVGNLTQKIHKSYLDVVTGDIILEKDWLTPIYKK